MDAILLASSLVASTRQDMKLSVSMVSKKHIAGYPSVRFHMAPEQTEHLMSFWWGRHMALEKSWKECRHQVSRADIGFEARVVQYVNFFNIKYKLSTYNIVQAQNLVLQTSSNPQLSINLPPKMLTHL